MSEELKPCPFCKSHFSGYVVERSGLEFYQCQNCDARVNSFDDWNTRPIEDALQSEIARLTARVQELEQERRWIPVSERRPEEGQPALIDFGNNEITVGLWFWENEPEEWANGTYYVGWQQWNYGWDKFFPSDEPPLHWQPLPQPPKETK